MTTVSDFLDDLKLKKDSFDTVAPNKNSNNKYSVFLSSFPAAKCIQYNLSKKIRKCSYAIAIIEPSTFMKHGSKCIIENTLYILKRHYDGTCTGETSAIIGVNKKFIIDLLDKDSTIYDILKSCDDLSDIDGIENLSPHRLTSIKYMIRFMSSFNDNELLLFNIEPKGKEAHVQKIYPFANVCLPGGGLEPQDESCYETAARREFYEETGLKLPLNNSKLKLLAKQKFNFPDRQAMYFIWKVKDFDN